MGSDDEQQTTIPELPYGSEVLLSGIIGSRAYGMDTPDSDTDRLGIWAAPTSLFHGFDLPIDRYATLVQHTPDVTLHEARKFLLLALKGNPTITELLWLERYETLSPAGVRLVDMREKLLSAPRVRSAYLGYATQQYDRLQHRGRFPDVPVSRIQKHARHLLRLLDQGTLLYQTGQLVVRVSDPQRYVDFGKAVAADHTAATPALRAAERAFDRPSPLPAYPDDDAAQAWLLSVRAEMWRP